MNMFLVVDPKIDGYVLTKAESHLEAWAKYYTGELDSALVDYFEPSDIQAAMLLNGYKAMIPNSKYPNIFEMK